jgi:hypothetical protein
MLTKESIQTFAEDWYRKLDVHAPMVEVLPMLVDDGLEMVFPEATVYGHAGFEAWFQRVIRIFFDEEHKVLQVDSDIKDDNTAISKVVVHWEASVWNAPEAYSKRIKLDAYQTWGVKEGPDGKPQITLYTVDDLKYHEGSAEL